MTVPSAIEYILVTSGVEGREEDEGKGMSMVRRRKHNQKKVEVYMHPSEPSRVARRWRAQAQLNHHWSW